MMKKTRFYGERGIITFSEGLVLRYEYVNDDWQQHVLLNDGTWHQYQGFDKLPDNVMKVADF